MYFRTGLDPDENDVVSIDTGFACEGPSLTVQSEKDDADINTIVRRFGLTGQVPVLQRVPLNEDFVDIIDFRSALDQIREAEDSFNQLPGAMRARFGNDPAIFVDFCSDRGNLPELRKMGLAINEESKGGTADKDVGDKVEAAKAEPAGDGGAVT